MCCVEKQSLWSFSGRPGQHFLHSDSWNQCSLCSQAQGQVPGMLLGEITAPEPRSPHTTGARIEAVEGGVQECGSAVLFQVLVCASRRNLSRPGSSPRAGHSLMQPGAKAHFPFLFLGKSVFVHCHLHSLGNMPQNVAWGDPSFLCQSWKGYERQLLHLNSVMECYKYVNSLIY